MDDTRLRIEDVKRNLTEVLAYMKELYNYDLLKVRVRLLDGRHVRITAVVQLPYKVER